MYRLLTILALTTLGCARARPVERVVQLSDSPQLEGPAEVGDKASDPWSWRTGRWQGQAPLPRPEIAWTNTLAGPVIYPLTTDGELLFAVAGGTVYAMDQQGIKRWTAEVQAVGPAVVEDVGLLVPLAAGRVGVFSAQTGELFKQTEPVQGRPAAPTLVDGVIAWTTAGGLLATSDGGRQMISESALAEIAVDRGQIYVGTKDGFFLRADRSGVLWRVPLPGPAVAHPVLDSSKVYVAYAGSETSSGGVVALARNDGALQWQADIRGGVSAGPALGALLVVPGRSGELLGLDPQHGGVRWKTPGYGPFTVQPLLANGMAYAGNADGRIHRVDLHDGGEAWAVDLGSTITGDPVLLGGKLYVGLTDGRLVCLK